MAAVLSAVSSAPAVESVEQPSLVAVPVQCETVEDDPAVAVSGTEKATEEAAAAVEGVPAVDTDVEAAVENLVTGVMVAVEMAVATFVGDESSAPKSSGSVTEADADVPEEQASSVILVDFVECSAPMELLEEKVVGAYADMMGLDEQNLVELGSASEGVDGEVECVVEDVVAVVVAIDEAATMKDDDLRTPEEISF
ncbi:uncharacterized protein IUM83_01031 [Phytophthora cinnamomi]|uniref:uncharacterized protein n=1 Tax=Phytophthora cinnamomi TaxID=4785 RepID=UPI00355A79E3|nr:hypothetical protein IUM83_01031 [Phytophthora cinnamomi]